MVLWYYRYEHRLFQTIPVLQYSEYTRVHDVYSSTANIQYCNHVANRESGFFSRYCNIAILQAAAINLQRAGTLLPCASNAPCVARGVVAASVQSAADMLARAAAFAARNRLRVSPRQQQYHRANGAPLFLGRRALATNTAPRSVFGQTTDPCLVYAGSERQQQSQADAGVLDFAPPAALDADVIATAAASSPASSASSAVDVFAWDSVTGPITFIQHGLATVQATTGMPWWVTFAAASLGLRIVLLPTTVYALRNAEKMARAGPDLVRLDQAFREGLRGLGASASFAQRRHLITE